MRKTKEQQEGQQKVRNFFIKWKDVFNLSGLAGRTENVTRFHLGNFLTYAPKKGDSSGYTSLSDEALSDLRKQFISLSTDLDKVISDIDDYLEKEA